MAIVLVDIDLTVVRSDIRWLAWLNYMSGKNLTLEDCNWDYDLSSYFPEVSDPFLFWSDPYLYDNLQPIIGSVEATSILHHHGHDIKFASYCKKGHFGSKVDWVKKHYPFMKGFSATKEKDMITADYFVDDRNEFLNQRTDSCRLIKYHTKYGQSEELKREISFIDDNWLSIADYILEQESKKRG
jgi:5'(3')-deoxyribonucleotidase